MTFYCNHCGKKLDEEYDYVDYDMDFDDLSYVVDLCVDCKEKLVEEVDDVVTRFVRGA